MKPKSIFQVAILNALPLLLAIGCAHNDTATQQADARFNPPVLQPTSDRAAQRVYSTTVTAPDGGQATLSKSQPGATAQDQQIAETVRKMITDDPTLAPYPSKVAASMDPASQGTVILSGWVPRAEIKRKLRDRVAALPGVTRVEDKLQVGFTPEPETFVAPDQNK